MYSHLYIRYNYKRTGRYVDWEPGGSYDTTEVTITLSDSKYEDPVTFNYSRWFTSVPTELAEDIRALGDTTRYDCQDIVPRLDKTIIQDIEIDAANLVKSNYLYLPLSSKDVTDTVYFDLDQALEQLGRFDSINQYAINKDPETYNIVLKLTGAMYTETISFSLINKYIVLYVHKDLDKTTKYIKGPDESTKQHQQDLKQLEEYQTAEDLAKTAKQEAEERAKREAAEKATLLQKLSNLSNEELKSLIKS